MFFQCTKCKQRWQFPLEKCPECFVPLERMQSQTSKIIGISKVEVPTASQLEVPYYIFVLQDEHGNVWAQKSQHKAEIGDSFEWETSNDKDTVAIARYKYDYSESLTLIDKMLGTISFNSESKVFVLPSLNQATHPYLRENTTPEFFEAVLSFLLNKGVKPENIKVGSQSFSGPLEAKAQKSGLLGVCLKYKIVPEDLAKGEFEKIDTEMVAKSAQSSDYIINLAPAREKNAMACQNITKIFQGKEAFDASDFDKVWLKLPKLINLVEAVYAQNEEQYTAYVGVILGSFHPLLADQVFNKIVYQELAVAQGYQDTKVVGVKINDVKTKI